VDVHVEDTRLGMVQKPDDSLASLLDRIQKWEDGGKGQKTEGRAEASS
jgi:hypothetical protein